MLIAILLIGLSFAWLLYETDFLRIRLPMGNRVNPKYARYTAYNGLKGTRFYHDQLVHSGNNYPVGYSPNGEPEYIISLNPGIDNVLCGWEWLDKHCADLVDYQPEVSMQIGGVRYQMTIKQPSIIKDIMRV